MSLPINEGLAELRKRLISIQSDLEEDADAGIRTSAGGLVMARKVVQWLDELLPGNKTEPNDLTVETSTYAGMRIFVDIKGQDGEALASVVKGATFAKPRRWEPAKVSCVFLPTDISNAKRHASALARAIEEAELLDRLYPPGTEGNDLHA